MTWLSLLGALAVLEHGRSPLSQGAGTPAILSTAPPPIDLDGVDVIGRRGAAPFPPEIELNAFEIDALGAHDVSEVVSRTAEMLGSDAEPIIMVNGRRSPNPSAYFGFPPDALSRVEVLPTDAGALYGAPQRRVLNIVLQSRFQSRDGLLEAERPTAGGMSAIAGDVRRASIEGEATSQAGLRASHDTSLRAGEREVEVGSQPGGDAVTLRPESNAVVANLFMTRTLGDWSGTFGGNGQAEETRSVSMFKGRPSEIERRAGRLTLTAGLSGQVQQWSTQFGVSAQFARADQAGQADSTSTNGAISARVDANRTILALPAGPLVANVSGETASHRSIIETDEQRTAQWSRSGDLAGAISIPLSRASPNSEHLSQVLGDVAVTLGANLRKADAGSGNGLNAALSWAPRRKLRLNSFWSTKTEGLTAAQRFAPVYYGAPIIVYDFQSGEAAEVLPTLGGNPDLRAPRLEQLAFGVSAGPFSAWKFIASANFTRLDAIDAVSALPVPTPEIEAAFPERFHRDAAGRLVGIDQRPINIRSAVSETLSSTLAVAVPLGARATSAGASGALRVTLNHTWRIRNTTVIRDGLPQMDRLEGDGGGVPAQELSMAIDARHGRWGLNAAARWRDAYRIRRDIGLDGPEDLRIASLATVDLKLSYQIERILAARAKNAPPRTGVGLRFELGVENLFDSRPAARLGNGRPAPGYGRDEQDPVGRTVRFAVKRRF